MRILRSGIQTDIRELLPRPVSHDVTPKSIVQRDDAHLCDRLPRTELARSPAAGWRVNPGPIAGQRLFCHKPCLKSAQLQRKSHTIISSEANRRLTGPAITANLAIVPSDRARDRGAGYPEGGGCEASQDRQVKGSGRPETRGNQAEIPRIVRPLGTSLCLGLAVSVLSSSTEMSVSFLRHGRVVDFDRREFVPIPVPGRPLWLTRRFRPHIVSSAVAKKTLE